MYSLEAKRALRFLLLFGVVSLLADVTYQGMRSLIGPFLGVLGASATTVGVLAGAGELVGYAVRLLFGYLADRYSRYWTLVFIGYAVNLLVVPFLALVNEWELAAAILILERLGKGIRAPSRDVLLSDAAGKIGSGWGWGIHEAMDQFGAVLGPLLMAAVLARTGSYHAGFALLLIPAILALAMLGITYREKPAVEHAAPRTMEGSLFRRYSVPYWLYMVGAGLVAAGYTDFALLAFHLNREAVFAPEVVPLLYALAMFVDALAALIFGRLFDRFGVVILAISVLIAAPFVALVLYGGVGGAITGMVLWGIGMGSQESILKAEVGLLAPREHRGVAYGMFNTVYGTAWFAGSALMGVLYDASFAALVAFSFVVQLLAAGVFLFIGFIRRNK